MRSRQSLVWVAISHSAGSGSAFQQEESTLTRLDADTAFLSRMQAALHPGAVLIVTDAPLSPESRSGKDFVIMS